MDLICNLCFRDMEQTFIKGMNTLRVNGMKGNVVDGVECTMEMVLFMKESGLMECVMAMECCD